MALARTPADEDIPGPYDRALDWNRPAWPKSKLDCQSEPRWNTRGDRVCSAQPADGIRRLAGFGDSFLPGSEVSDVEAFGAQLEALEPKVEFMNFGVAGYGLDQALLHFRTQNERLHADVVVVDVHVDCVRRIMNRCRSWQQPTAKQPRVKPRFRPVKGNLNSSLCPSQSNRELVERALAEELPTLVGKHEHWLGDDALFPHSALDRIRAAYTRREYEPLWLDRDGEAFQITLAILDTFRKEALESGASDFVILLFSNFRDVPRRDPIAGVDFLMPLREELERMQFHVLDFDRSMAREMDPQFNSREHVFHSTHFNARGNRFVAQALLGWLRTKERFNNRFRPVTTIDRCLTGCETRVFG